MKETTGQIIKRLRMSAGMSQQELAKKAGIHQTTMSQIEKSIYKNPKTLARIADILGVPLSLITDPTEGTVGKPTTRTVPLYATVPAGPPDALSPERIGEIEILSELWGPNRYGLRVSGDSMFPLIQHTDIVLVEYYEIITPEMAHNKICVVKLNNSPLLKRVRVQWSTNGAIKQINLESENPKYKPIAVKREDELVIQGILIAIVHRSL